MSSFFADTLAIIAHQLETVFAFLSVSRPIMNSSVAPVALSRDEIWDLLCSDSKETAEDNYLKLFSTFCDTMQFTKKIRFHFYPKYAAVFQINMLTNLIENKRYFTSTLQHLDFPSSDSIPQICDAEHKSKFRNLSSISIKHCEAFSDNHLMTLCQNLPLLQKLDLSVQQSLTESIGFAPIGQLSQLCELDLSFSCVASLSFLKNLRRLEKLDLNSCQSVTDQSFDFDLMSAVNNNNNNNEKNASQLLLFPSLREINLADCQGITDAFLEKLQHHAPNLSVLTANQTSQIGYEAIAKMEDLRHLALTNCQGLDEEPFKQMMASLTNLEKFAIPGAESVGDEALRAIAGSPSPIRILDLNCCFELCNPGFSHLASMCHLESVSIGLCDDFDGFTNTNDDEEEGDDDGKKEGMMMMSANTLQSLKFTDCPGIADSGLKALLSGLSCLKILDLFGCEEITTEGLNDALTASKSKNSLEELNLSFTSITDLRFLKDLRALKILNLSSTMELDFPSMRQNDSNSMNDTKNNKIGFSLIPSSLETLILAQTLVEDVDLAQIPVSALQNLKGFDVNGCTNMSFEFLFMTPIPKMRNLEELNITIDKKSRYSLIREKLEVILGKLPYLKRLSIKSDLVTELLKNNEFMKKYGDVIVANSDSLVEE